MTPAHQRSTPPRLELLEQGSYLSICMPASAGTNAHSIVYSTPLDNGFDTWRRLVHRFDPPPAQANASLMNKILKPSRGTVDNITFLVETWADMVRRQGGRSGRQSLADETTCTILMDMCSVELERHIGSTRARRFGRPSATMLSKCATRAIRWRWARWGGQRGPRMGNRVGQRPRLWVCHR